MDEFRSRGLLRKVDANGTPDEVWDLTRQLFLVGFVVCILHNKHSVHLQSIPYTVYIVYNAHVHGVHVHCVYYCLPELEAES